MRKDAFTVGKLRAALEEFTDDRAILVVFNTLDTEIINTEPGVDGDGTPVLWLITADVREHESEGDDMDSLYSREANAMNDRSWARDE